MTRAVDNHTMTDLLADPLPETVPDVLDLIAEVQQVADQWPPRKEWDGLACFNYLYHVITQEVLERLVAGTTFRDPEFLARLDVEFARRYFIAVREHAAGLVAPRSWRVLFDRRTEDIDPIRFAVAGVNAHVNFDLAFALVTTCQVLPRPLDGSVRADYDAINDVFSEHMSGLRQHFEDRLEQVLDKVLFDDFADDAGNLTVVLARDAAWRRAEHLWTLRGRPAFDREREAVDRRASLLGLGILAFGRL